MGGLSDLDFDPGLSFQHNVTRRFGSPVSHHPSSSSGPFFLVVSFSRSSIKITDDSVGFMVQSCLGGTAKDFQVTHLKDWCFRISVFSKAVGFLIDSLRKFACPLFSLHFALWGNGGPNWVREFEVWCNLEESQWTFVSSRKKSYAAVVQNRSADFRQATKKTVFQRLAYPTNYSLNYADEQQGFFSAPIGLTKGNFQKDFNGSSSSIGNSSQYHQKDRVVRRDDEQGQRLNFENLRLLRRPQSQEPSSIGISKKDQETPSTSVRPPTHGRTPHPPPPPPARWMPTDRHGPVGHGNGNNGAAGLGDGPVHSAHGSAASGTRRPQVPLVPPGFEASLVPVARNTEVLAAPALNAEGLFSCLSNHLLGNFDFTVSLPMDMLSVTGSLSQDVAGPSAIQPSLCITELPADVEVPEGDQVNVNAAAEEEDTEESLEEINKPADLPKRRRKRVVPEHTSLLRRSRRIEAIHKGFKPTTTPAKDVATSSSSGPSAAQKKKGKEKLKEAAPLVLYEGRFAPGALPAPQLSVGIAQAIGTKFCKMRPEVESGRALLQGDDDSTTD
ncbi:hypothetical protein EJB05_53081, partial [Eragrostis curvula]